MIANSRPLLAAMTAVLAATILAGCSTDAPAPTPTPSTTATAPAATPGLTDVTDTPGSGENLVGALADSATTSCERSGDAWTVAGTVTNPTDAPADYRIYVSLLSASNDTRALVQVDVSGVEAAATSDWTTEIPVAEDDLVCILRVERYES